MELKTNRKYFICEREGCYKKHYAKGLCLYHWTRRNVQEKSLDKRPVLTDQYYTIKFDEDWEKELKSTFYALLKLVSPRFKKIIQSRWGLKEEPLTLKKTAKKYNLSRERVRQIEIQATRYIRNKLSKYLNEFV